MKNRVLGILVTGLIMASLAGCGAKTEATEQVAESSEVVEADNVDETENVSSEENESASVGAEDDSIVLYAERGHQDYIPLDETEYEAHTGTISATEDIPLYDGKGYSIGHIKNGSTVSVTEYGVNAWARFENPIDEVDYDYLYVKKEYVIGSEEVHLNAVSMAQGIKQYINHYGVQDVEYTFLNEKTSDMELFECRMDSAYENQMMYEYWIAELITRNDEVNPLIYETLYIECEEDTDGWIICRIYYKDLIEN